MRPIMQHVQPTVRPSVRPSNHRKSFLFNKVRASSPGSSIVRGVLLEVLMMKMMIASSSASVVRVAGAEI